MARIDGGADTDLYDASAATSSVTVNLGAGSASGAEIGTDTLANVENATGGSGDDALTGDGGANALSGGAGNDTLVGGAGNDVLDGGAGVDLYDASATTAGVAVTLGESATGAEIGTDTLANVENATGGSGNDELIGDVGANALSGGSGNDRLVGAGGDDALDGGAGNDTVDGGVGDDVLRDGAGADEVLGGTGNDVIDGALDAIEDNYRAGGGADTIRYAAAIGAVTIDLTGGGLPFGTASGLEIGSDRLFDFENLQGGLGNDTLIGDEADNVVFASPGDDDVDGGLGSDTYDASAASAPVAIDLGAGTASGAELGDVQLAGIENATGGSGDDALTGDGDDNVLIGNAGTDTVIGGGGDDTIVARSGDGDDTIVGGGGSDTYDASTATAAVAVNLGTGTATSSEIGSDSLVSVESALGGAGADSLIGSAAANTLSGGAGNDVLAGAGDDDTLIGGAGNDSLTGGDGDDSLVGGSGFDVAHFSGPRVDYSIDLELRTVTHDEGSEGTDSFSTVERLVFGNGVIFDIQLPLPADDAFVTRPSGNQIFDVLANDLDANGQPLDPEDVLSLEISTFAEHGLAYSLEDGRIIYVGNDGFTGLDSFEYAIETIHGVNTARVEVFVIGAGSPPETSFVNGSSAGESLVGTAINNFLFAAGGNDDLYALLGSNTLDGGTGNDALVADGGQNQLSGRLGTDLFVISNEPVSINDFDIITDLQGSRGRSAPDRRRRPREPRRLDRRRPHCAALDRKRRQPAASPISMTIPTPARTASRSFSRASTEWKPRCRRALPQRSSTG